MFSLSNKNVLTKRHVFVALILIYRVFLDYSYLNIATRAFGYAGFKNERTIIWLVLSYVILFFSLHFGYKCFCSINTISKQIVFVLYLLSFLPFTTMVSYGQFDSGFVIGNSCYWFFIFLFTSIFHIYKKKNIHIVPIRGKVAKWLLYGLFFLLAATVVYVSGRYTGFRFNFSLSNVYSLREDAESYSLPTVISYIYSWSRRLFPIYTVFFYTEKKRTMFWLSIAIQLLNFGIEGSKSVFFLMICAVILCHFSTNRVNRINKYLLIGVSSLTFLATIMYRLFDSLSVGSLLNRRLMYVPVLLSSYYFDYFTVRTPDFFKGSFLRLFGFHTDYPELVKVIGRVYAGLPDTNCNNGLISDAMTNLGYFGILIFPVIICFVLSLLDNSSEYNDSRIGLLIAVNISYSLMNATFFTALLTHGILVMIIMAFLIREYKIHSKIMSDQSPYFFTAQDSVGVI